MEDKGRKLLLPCRRGLQEFCKNFPRQLYISSLLRITFIKMNMMQYQGKKHSLQETCFVRWRHSQQNLVGAKKKFFLAQKKALKFGKRFQSRSLLWWKWKWNMCQSIFTNELFSPVKKFPFLQYIFRCFPNSVFL